MKNKIKKFWAMSKTKKRHFLTFEQVHFMGVDCGPTDLFYQVKGSEIVITFRFKDEDEKELIKIEKTSLPLKTQLEDLLVDFFSHPGNFLGTPEYQQSDMITKEEFDWILQNAIDIIDGKKTLANYKSSELLDLLYKFNLDPEPTGDNLYNLEAKCPTGRPHNMMVSMRSNEWGCGYCRIKGGVKELIETYNKYKE